MIFIGTSPRWKRFSKIFIQFDRMVGRTQVLNAGSVGAPYGEPGRREPEGPAMVLLRAGRAGGRKPILRLRSTLKRWRTLLEAIYIPFL